MNCKQSNEATNYSARQPQNGAVKAVFSMATNSILTLTIKREHFDAIKSGKKTKEYRIANKFYASRIENKQINKVLFKNGYSRNAPMILVKCLLIKKKILRIDLYDTNKKEFYVLHLGEILKNG